ncbi:chromatin associated protein KTI12 [Neoconidiobolus thromboides FSU 785]|nr:chromatin associated protein KTI12 [Neoconidiobolus thromboides FSU 785]
MPLITLCGLPSSGKSTIATQLKIYIENKLKSESLTHKVELYNDEKLGFFKSSYATQYEEKKLRGALLACAERLVNKDTILILDSNNYIKGFRYQLYCVARANATNHCVVQFGLQPQIAMEWNEIREDKYSEQVITELINRYEEPIAFNRWDSPLFLIIPTDDSYEEIFSQIYHSIIHEKSLKPTQATVIQPITTTNHLYEVDKLVTELIQQILSMQNENKDSVLFLPNVDTPLNKKGKFLSIIEMKKQKREFVTFYKKQKSVIELERIPNLFIQFLNETF